MLGVSKVLPKESVLSHQGVVMHPKTIEGAFDVCGHVRQGRLCIIDVTDVEENDAQRIADFLHGVSDGVGGTISRVNADIFIVAPPSQSVYFYGDDKSAFYGGFTRKAASGA